MKFGNPDNSAIRRNEIARNHGVPIRGDQPRAVPADFADMLASLPDADSGPRPNRSARIDEPQAPVVQSANFTDMLAGLPDAEPGTADAQPAVVREQSISMAAPPQVVARLPKRRTPAPVEQPVSAIDGQFITRRIMEQLEKHKTPAVSQLRIEVHNGVVIVAGEVPTPYEKQLIGHFCRKTPGVERFVDTTVVRNASLQTEKRPASPRPPKRQHIEWQLPFRAWHVGAALGLMVLVWGAISLGRGRGPERMAVHPLTGTLVFEGQPAAGAAIVLYPQDPSISVRPRASVKDDGSFAVTSYEPDDGAPAGDYRVTVEWRRPVAGQESGGDDLPPPNVLPSVYAIPQTTPLKVSVKEGENEFPAITFQN
jgi:hypothetical protein